MGLQGVKAKNHPQQSVNGRGDLEADERYTPRALISELHARHRFTIDVASDPRSPAAKIIGRFWTRQDDGLLQRWDGERVWCNPPFLSIAPWVAKAWRSRAEVVMLVPGCRTEQPWWQTLVEPWRDRGAAPYLLTRFLANRTQFGTPEVPEGKRWNSSPPFGCVLLTWPTQDRPADLSFVDGGQLPLLGPP